MFVCDWTKSHSRLGIIAFQEPTQSLESDNMQIDSELVFQAHLTRIKGAGVIEKATAEALAAIVGYKEDESTAAEQRMITMRDEALQAIFKKLEDALVSDAEKERVKMEADRGEQH